MTAAVAAGWSPCLVPQCKIGPLVLWGLDHLGSFDFHLHRHHSNQHPAFHYHPNSAVAVVVAPKLAVVQSAGAVPFVAVALTVDAVP